MKAKTIGTVVLLAFVAISVGYLIVSETNAPAAAEAPAGKEVTSGRTPGPGGKETGETATTDDKGSPVTTDATEPSHKVVAYYFHNTMRCVTCLKIEELAEQALREELTHAFESGALEWHALNMEEPAYQHFALDYGLVTSSLVFVNTQDGEQRDWTNMDKVWQLVDDEHAFRQYVVEQAKAYLES